MPGDPVLSDMNALPHVPGTSELDNLFDITLNPDTSHNWEMISLGLEEPLPSQDVMDELHHLYFENVHPSMPIIHRPRYFVALNSTRNMQPPICLRYIIWSLAAAISDKYCTLHDHFYKQARKYLEMDEMKASGEYFTSAAHCQCLVLMCTYEYSRMYLPRSWLTMERAAGLAKMLALDRLDAQWHGMRQCIPPAKGFAEKEERRRIFWGVYCADRSSSMATGWSMSIDDVDVGVNGSG